MLNISTSPLINLPKIIVLLRKHTYYTKIIHLIIIFYIISGKTPKETKKKKYVKLSVKEKCCLVQDVESGMRKSDAAKKYHIDKSSVTYILQKKEKFLSANENKFLRKKCRLDKGQHPLLESALLDWIKQKRSQGIAINGPIIKEKASLMNEELMKMESEKHKKKADQDGSEATESEEFEDQESETENVQDNSQRNTFKASDGWLSKFKARFGMRQIKLSGEKLSADLESADNAKNEIGNFIVDNGYSMDNVYNADETGLYHKSLPEKTLALKSEKSASGFKANKERITIMNCANASGSHKIPLLMIGKSAKPRCFRNANVGLPVEYTSQSNSWMTSKRLH